MEFVKLLAAYGADTQTRDAQSQTAAEVASKPEIAEFLRVRK